MLLSHLLIQWPLCYNIILIQLQFNIVLISAGFLKWSDRNFLLFRFYFLSVMHSINIVILKVFLLLTPT
jgi:hypothetical protein